MDPPPQLSDVFDALLSTRWNVDQARKRLQPVPGLYAIYGDADAWHDLGLEPRPENALYVGKSESSLVGRDLTTHFAADKTGKARTGSSTVRRSFAALLSDSLDLQATPRNPGKPGKYSHYALTAAGDARLTAWMHERLTLAAWEKTTGVAQPLSEIESAVIRCWKPPINIQMNPRPLQRLKLAREAMARQAAASALVPGNSTPSTPGRDGSGEEPVAAQARMPRGPGFTPVELARELGKDPKTVRHVLRTRYGPLPHPGDRWGVLTAEQENHVRARLAPGT
ncbi:hypothetical protein BLJ79_20655 [Arthrobacter sp. UCD-GKA]|uniref:GIY-YIG nuclease family protein n=1 Tax=Arthrobacter sp. UCD-GKA TaxID=1913576 RepID=UPI0008DCD643|nr:hypothetical protein [Arthrobacter sp. UCD-GKA]OIH82127.1 hypothetical protein BLJ79_20655 [Arthrobacter sp. UCD-GKA]